MRVIRIDSDHCMPFGLSASGAYGDPWNLRDWRMFETLRRILAWAGPDRKAVVRAHNPHIGEELFTRKGPGQDPFSEGPGMAGKRDKP